MKKFSTAMGSALPDPVAAEARLSPVPVPAIENKTAPGQRGPVGLSPRTTYSRVNTGTPPVPDAGMSAQKSAPPRGSEFLPNKLAHQEVFMATSADRPSLNDMVKAAMAGTIAKSEITREALRQTGEEFSTKIASAQFSDNHVSTQDVHKLASALGYLAGTFRKEAYDLGPGAGPGSLEVSAPKASGTSLDAGESGHAIASNQPPMTPALQAEKAQSGKANTGLEDNMGKKASANFSRLMRMGDEPVETGLPINFIRKLAAEGPDSSASGEGVPSEPGDVTSQKNMIASNMAAINYTKREAKAGAKRDVNKYLDQPALTAAGDAVLARSLEHTNSAGAKIAGAVGDHLERVGRKTVRLVGRTGGGEAAMDPATAKRIGATVYGTGAAAAGGAGYVATRDKESGAKEMYAGAKKGVQRYGSLLKGGKREELDAAAMVGGHISQGMAKAERRAVNVARGATGAGAAALGAGGYAATRKKESSADFSKVAAARALLSNLIEKVAEEQDGKKKTKEAVVPLNISSPSDSSGFQAQQLK